MSQELMKRLAGHLRRKSGNHQYAKVAIDDVAALIDLLGGLAKAIDDQNKAIAALRNGNFKLIEALMAMVGQFFDSQTEAGKFDMDGEVFSHRHMSAEEMAISVLIAAGFAQEVEKGKNGYRLREDLLEQRRVELQQKAG